MEKVGVLAVLTARAGKEDEVARFLESALPLAQRETKTVRWFALRLDETRFGIFDTFADDAGRQEHLNGQIAQQLFARAEELFSKPPQVDMVTLLAVK